jgi:hypothetical protein
MTDLPSSEHESVTWQMQLRRFLLREWPYLLMLVLALFGVAYTSVTRSPITLYWFALAPFIGFVCVLTRWSAVKSKDARLHMVWTQVLHWGAVLAAMNLLYVADVGQMMSTDTRALYVLTLLALGAFTAGVHIGSWRICLVGVVLALGVPAIAWLEQVALLLALGVVIAIGIAAPLVWRYTKDSPDAKDSPGDKTSAAPQG